MNDLQRSWLRSWLACACGVPVSAVTDEHLAAWTALRHQIVASAQRPTEEQARGVRAHGHRMGVHFDRDTKPGKSEPTEADKWFGPRPKLAGERGGR